MAQATQRVPIRTDPDGVVRVARTRVTLDSLVAAFRSGSTPEEIAQQYPSLDLADIYSVIAYYLRHEAEVENYLADRRREATRVRKQNERRFDPSGIRARLMARKR